MPFGHRAENRQHRMAVRDLAHGNVIGAMAHEQRAANIHHHHERRDHMHHLRQEERWQHHAAARDLAHGNVVGAMAHESAAERAHATNAAMHGRPFAAARHQAEANRMAAATVGAAAITGAAIATAAGPVVVGPPPPQQRVVVVQPTVAPAMMAQPVGYPTVAQPACTAGYPAAPMAGYPAPPPPPGAYPAGAAPIGVPVVAGGPVGVATAQASRRPTNVAVEITGYTDYPAHTVYCVQTECDLSGARLRFASQQRFSAFAQLHETLRQRQPAMARALPRDFPVPKALFNGGDQLKQERRAALQQYLRVAVAAAPPAGLPPVLAKFLGM